MSYEELLKAHPVTVPQGLPAYTGALDQIKQTVNLAGSKIQVIVKLANIVLTPERPKYPGGSWHVEGKLMQLAS
jgi:hypothetical protein